MSDSIEGKRVSRRSNSDAEHEQHLERQRQLAEKMFGRQQVKHAATQASQSFGNSSMSDSFEGQHSIRRSSSDAEYDQQLELQRQRAAKLVEQQQSKLAAAEARRSSRSSIELVLIVFGVLSVAGGLIGGMLAAADLTVTSMLVTSGIMSAVGLFWMAQVLGTLLEIRDRLD